PPQPHPAPAIRWGAHRTHGLSLRAPCPAPFARALPARARPFNLGGGS
ncbi:MAG: hypothetical protein JWQ12_232, partial [Glaciihabitans sp.]|nr:hypothetical protein [Glaciihabitans sp.]